MYSTIRKIKSSHSSHLNIPRIEVRRSSSLQFPLSSPIIIDDAKLSEVSALSRSSSIYSSNNQSQYSVNPKMHKCRAYVGCCQLRLASCLIGMLSIGISVITICCLLSVSGNLSAEVQSMVTAPIAGLVLFQIATAMLLIIGVLIDTHYLLVPFLLNTVVHVCLAIGIATTVLISANDIRRVYGPHIVIVCAVGLALYVWFTCVVAMTIALIRHKRRQGEAFGNYITHSYDHQEDFETSRPIDRVSSTVI
uniref:MARVEL domain-containing protein n=1 Tax=Haemonchus contortus TaxID=6289 RepID=A0A7I4YPF8_HAECO